MQVINPEPLLHHLETKSRLHRLVKDMIITYPNQLLTTAVWLKKGIIRLNEDTKGERDLTRPGLYFLDELSRELPFPHAVKVLAESELWLVTRSELTSYLGSGR